MVYNIDIWGREGLHSSPDFSHFTLLFQSEIKEQYY